MTQRTPRRLDPFTVGIIQEAATANVAANVEVQIARVRDAASAGAQVVCLQ